MVGPNEFQYDQLYRSMLREAVFTIPHKIRAQDPDANQIVFAFPSRSVVLSPGDPQIEGYRQRGITPYYDPNRNVYKIEFNVGQSFLSIQDEAQIQFIKKKVEIYQMKDIN